MGVCLYILTAYSLYQFGFRDSTRKRVPGSRGVSDGGVHFSTSKDTNEWVPGRWRQSYMMKANWYYLFLEALQPLSS